VAISAVLLGYICGRAVLDEAEIVKIAVKHDARRQGVATRLLSHASGKVSIMGCAPVILRCAVPTSPRDIFMKRRGFL